MEEASYKELDLWIREELSQHGEWLVDRFIDALERNRNIDTGELAESFDYRTATEQGAQTLTVSFLTRGRLMEVAGRRRRKSASGGFPAGSNRKAWAKKNHPRKKVEWYNRNRYAGYGRLIRRLTAGMSDQELQRIRGILERAKQELV